jgi:ZIP family zinc transporter
MSTTGVARAQPTSSVSWREHVRAHPLVAGGLAIGVLAVCFLLAESLVSLNEGGPSRALVLALYGGTAGFLTTALGALPALLLRTMPQRLADTLMGMAAGMMLAATAFSLLLPGIDAGTHILGNAPLGACIVVFGMALGVLLMLGLEQFTPHEHESTGPCGPGYARYPGRGVSLLDGGRIGMAICGSSPVSVFRKATMLPISSAL